MNKITVIFHSADFDGIFCREIARKFLPPDTTFIGWDYRDKKIDPLTLPEGLIYILDLSPECFEGTQNGEVLLRDRDIIWIDHHKSAIDKFSHEIPGIRIDGVAACRLSWIWFAFVEPQIKSVTGSRDWVQRNYPFPTLEEFVERKIQEPLAVRLAGEYDIWDKRDPRAETFQFGLRSRELGNEDWNQLLDVAITQLTTDLLIDGKLLQKYQQRNDANSMPRTFKVLFEGMVFLAINSVRFNSLTFMAKDFPETGHEALMGFYFDGKYVNFSLYHAKGKEHFDLSPIAVKWGGGGHRGACGFKIDEIAFREGAIILRRADRAASLPIVV